MEFAEVMKKRKRMCDFYRTETKSCIQCELCLERNKKMESCYSFTCKFPEEAQKIISKWDRKHQEETNLQHFERVVKPLLEKEFREKIMICCIRENTPNIFCANRITCEDCQEFWNSPYKGDK